MCMCARVRARRKFWFLHTLGRAHTRPDRHKMRGRTQLSSSAVSGLCDRGPPHKCFRRTDRNFISPWTCTETKYQIRPNTTALIKALTVTVNDPRPVDVLKTASPYVSVWEYFSLWPLDSKGFRYWRIGSLPISTARTRSNTRHVHTTCGELTSLSQATTHCPHTAPTAAHPCGSRIRALRPIP